MGTLGGRQTVGRLRRGGRGAQRSKAVSLADAGGFQPVRLPQVPISVESSSDSFVERTQQVKKRADGAATITSMDSLNLLKTQGGSTTTTESSVPPARQMLAARRGHWRAFGGATRKAGAEIVDCQEVPPASMQRVFATPPETVANASARPRFIDDTTVRFYEGRSAMVPVVYALAKKVFRGDYAPDPLLQSLHAARVVADDGASRSRWSSEESHEAESLVSSGRVEKLLMSYNRAKAQSSRSEEWDGRLPSVSNSNAACDNSIELSDSADARPLMAAAPVKNVDGDWLLPSGTDSSHVDIQNVEPGGGRITNFAASHLSLETTTRKSSSSQTQEEAAQSYRPQPTFQDQIAPCSRPNLRRVLRKSRISLLGKPIRSVFPSRRIKFETTDQTM